MGHETIAIAIVLAALILSDTYYKVNKYENVSTSSIGWQWEQKK